MPPQHETKKETVSKTEKKMPERQAFAEKSRLFYSIMHAKEGLKIPEYPIMKVMDKFSSLDSMDILFNGRYIDNVVKKELKEVDKLVEDTADSIGIRGTTRKNLREAILRFIKDSTILYKVATAVAEDARFKDTSFMDRLDHGISSAYNSIVSFLYDYSQLSSIELVERNVSRILSKQAGMGISRDREMLETLATDVSNGKNRELLQDLINRIKPEKTGVGISFFPYTMLNYRPDSIWETMAAGLSLMNENKVGEDILTRAFAHNEFLCFPVLNLPPFGTISYMLFLDEEKPKLSQELRKVISEMHVYKGIPYRSIEWVAKMTGFETMVKMARDLAFVNRDILNRVRKRKLPEEIILDFVVKSLKEKQISILPDVLPSFWERRFAKDAVIRSVDMGINDYLDLVGHSVREILWKWTPLIEFAVKDKDGQSSIAYTYGDRIYVLPFVSTLNTSFLNNCIYFRLIKHEINHIYYGSFRYDPDKKPEIDIERFKDKFEAMYSEKDEKEIHEFQEILNEAFETTNKELKHNIELGVLRIIEWQKSFLRNLDKIATEKENDYAIKMATALQSGGILALHAIMNIFEDYRIDQYFELADEDESLYYDDKKTLQELQGIYKFSKYLLLYLSAQEYIALMKKGNIDKKVVDAMNLALYVTKLGPLFKDLFSEYEKPDLFYEEIKTIQKKLVEFYPDGRLRMRLVANNSFEAAVEYFALMMLFPDAIRSMPSQKGGQVKRGKTAGQEPGKGTEKGAGETEKEAGETGEEQEETEEGAGETEEEQEETEEEEEETRVCIEKDLEAKGNMCKLKKGYYNEEIVKKEKEKKDVKDVDVEVEPAVQEHETVIPEKLVLMYKDALMDIAEGRIETEEILGKRGSRVEPKRLTKFIYRKGTGPVDFLKRKEHLVSEEGMELRSRPIDIYVGIDTSGSMTEPRTKRSVLHALALFAAFNELRHTMREANINLKLMSIATGTKIEIMEFDVDAFIFSRKNRDFIVRYHFEQVGGGTDLVMMIEKFRERIQKIQNETVRSVLTGGGAINPSILIIYFTDFGDNAGNATGVANAVNNFGKFATKYRNDSSLINIAMNEVGVSVIFCVPDIAPDDVDVFQAVKNIINKDVLILSRDDSDGLVNAIKRSIPILNGEKSSNIKET